MKRWLMPENTKDQLRDHRPSNNAFELDDRICLKIDRELGPILGSLILSTNTNNPALLALGHQLRSLTNDH